MHSIRRIDLTQGPVLGNLVRLSVPIAVSMIVFALYLLADLYFVGKLGPDAVAALSISINAFFVHLGISTILGTGALVLIAQAFGRGRPEEAGEIFRQTLIMGLWGGIALSSLGVALAEPYMRFFGASGRLTAPGPGYFCGDVNRSGSSFRPALRDLPSRSMFVADCFTFRKEIERMAIRYWLMKSDPEEFSIAELRASPNESACWDGVRNYQARNFMRDDMQIGDRVLFYHSGRNPAVMGTARVVKTAYPDDTAWDPHSRHYDSKSKPGKPIWYMVDIQLEKEFNRPIPLAELRQVPELKNMMLLKTGMRLSVQPVSREEFKRIEQLGQ